MSDLALFGTRIRSGVWEGKLTGDADRPAPPRLAATHLDRALDGVEVTAVPEEKGVWRVRVVIPPDLLSDGVQTVVITEVDGGERLASFALIAGDAADDDFRAEFDLLRTELDMLKKAFRRHCVETMGG